MKQYHEIISDHVFRGRNSGHINSVTRLIYGAKFFNDIPCRDSLVRFSAGDIDAKRFDAIVPVNIRDSRYNLTCALASRIAKRLNIQYKDALYDHNTHCKSSVKGLRILVFDDVIYTGTTMSRAVNAVRLAGARSITGYAIAKSKKFKTDFI